jgi:phage shock protein E
MIRRLLRRAAGRALKRDPAPPAATRPTPEAPAPELEPEPEPEPELEVDDAGLARWMMDGEPLVLLDIREAHELQHGVAQGALLIRMNDIPQRLDELPPLDTRVVVYCAAGGRSFGVTHWLRENGWTDVWSLSSGYHGYLRVSDQVSKANDIAGKTTLAGLEQIELALGPASRPRLVIHWATWCEGCIEELPLLTQLHRRFRDQVDFVGLSWDGFQAGLEGPELLEQVRSVSSLHQLDWPSMVVTAQAEALFSALKITVQTVPQIWLISADGEVQHRHEEVLTEEMLPTLILQLKALSV